jgi:aldose sugar dehydrogenase
MTRAPVLALLLAFVLALAACNGNDEPDPEPAPGDTAETPTPEPEETPAEEAEATPEPEMTPEEAEATPEPDEDTEPQETPEEAEPEEPADPELTTVTDAVDMPSSIVFTPDGRVLFNEVYAGRIRVIQDGELLDQPFAEFNVAQPPRYTEHGLLGLALDPDFEDTGHVYIFYTVADGEGEPLHQRIVRLTDQDNIGVDEEIIVDELPAGPRCCHNGGRIAFGPDGLLYVTLGDVEDAGLSQDPNTLAGSILRYNPDGSVPEDNPFGAGNPVYAYGLRNPFGLTFHPETSELFVTENGPDGYDEVNLVRAGENYGWPEARGMSGDPNYVDPIWATGQSGNVAPTGIVIPTGDVLPDLAGHVLFCEWNTSTMRMLRLEGPDYDSVVGEDEMPFGCQLDVAQGPDGALYFSDQGAIYRFGP